MTPSLQTLFLPLEDGAVKPDGPALFLGAAHHPYLKNLKADCWQPWKPLAESLPDVLPAIPKDSKYALVLIDLPKQVDEAKHWIACGLRALKPGGTLVIAAANDANGNRLVKWLGEAGIACESESKNKCRVVWAQRPKKLPDIIEEWGLGGAKQSLQSEEGIEFISQPGLFGWDKIDVGSHLLAEILPENIKGNGADFGCGYGYLSLRILEQCKNITALHLIDADSRALDCARDNLEDKKNVAYVWADLSKPSPDLPKFDFIVMNPPFHTGKITQGTLGQAFISTAAHHLKKGGTLWMVANAHLPYEVVLQENFTRVKMTLQKDGFKIFEAVK